MLPYSKGAKTKPRHTWDRCLIAKHTRFDRLLTKGEPISAGLYRAPARTLQACEKSGNDVHSQCNFHSVGFIFHTAVPSGCGRLEHDMRRLVEQGLGASLQLNLLNEVVSRFHVR